MLLLGALFALFVAGFLALLPGRRGAHSRRECPGLPKAAWIALVAGTFIIGAAMWLAVRRPARPTVSPAPPGRDPDDLPPQRRNAAIPRSAAPAHVRRPGIARPCPGRTTWARCAAGRALPAAASVTARAGLMRPQGTLAGRRVTQTARVRPGHVGGQEAAAALLRHPAGRSRPRSASSPARPKGPDDDPEFLSSLNRAIHGAEPAATTRGCPEERCRRPRPMSGRSAGDPPASLGTAEVARGHHCGRRQPRPA